MHRKKKHVFYQKDKNSNWIEPISLNSVRKKKPCRGHFICLGWWTKKKTRMDESDLRFLHVVDLWGPDRVENKEELNEDASKG